MHTTETVNGQDWDVRREEVDSAVCVRRYTRVGDAYLLVIEEHEEAKRDSWSQVSYISDVNQPTMTVLAVRSYPNDPERAQRVAEKLVALSKVGSAE